MSYLTVPVYGGTSAAIAKLRLLLQSALTTNKRIALVGDSQEDVTGDAFCDNLNAEAFARLGVCSETAIPNPTNWGTTPGYPSWWCTAGARTANIATVVPASYIPPGVGVIGQTANASLNLRIIAAHKADSQVWSGAGLSNVIDPTGGYSAEMFFYTNTAGPEFAIARTQKFAGGPAAGSFSKTQTTSQFLTTSLNGSDNTAVREVLADCGTYDAAEPYTQILLGSSVASNIQILGARLIAKASSGGIVWQPFSVGGYNTTDLSTHADCGPMFKLMGGANGWDAVAIGLCVNNAYTLEQDKATYKTALSGVISTVRAWNGNADTLILLLGDPPVTGSGWPAGALDKFNQYAEAQYEVANETAGVVSINSQRVMTEAGYDPANAVDSADGLHPTAAGNIIRSRVISESMFLAGGSSLSVLSSGYSVTGSVDAIVKNGLPSWRCSFDIPASAGGGFPSGKFSLNTDTRSWSQMRNQ